MKPLLRRELPPRVVEEPVDLVVRWGTIELAPRSITSSIHNIVQMPFRPTPVEMGQNLAPVPKSHPDDATLNVGETTRWWRRPLHGPNYDASFSGNLILT